MPRRRRNAGVEEFVDDVGDTAVGSFFNRASHFVERIRDGQRSSFSEEQLRQQYKCAGCHKVFNVTSMEMLHPSNGFGTCKNCWSFMWDAAQQKIVLLSKRAVRSRPARRRSRSAPKPPTEPPWEVLGIDIHASVAVIRKAYNKLAMQWHPDRWNGASPEERHRAALMFKKVIAAREVMLKVRQPPEE